MSDENDLMFSNDVRVPMCATFTSYPTTTRINLYMYADGGRIDLRERYPNEVHVDKKQCNFTTELFISSGISETVFQCSVMSPWESLSVNFSISNRKVQPQTCLQEAPASTEPLPSLTPQLLSSPLPTRSVTATATPQSSNGGPSKSPVGVIAGVTALVGIIILIVVAVLVMVIVRCRSRSVKPRQMYKLPEISESSFVTGPSEGLLMRPSPGGMQANSLGPPIPPPSMPPQLTHNGIPVSRQMAKVAL